MAERLALLALISQRSRNSNFRTLSLPGLYVNQQQGEAELLMRKVLGAYDSRPYIQRLPLLASILET